MQAQTRHEGEKENLAVKLTLEQKPETNMDSLGEEGSKRTADGGGNTHEGVIRAAYSGDSQQLDNPGLYLRTRGIIVKSFACPENNKDFIILLWRKLKDFLKSDLHLFLTVDSHSIIENQLE